MVYDVELEKSIENQAQLSPSSCPRRVKRTKLIRSWTKKRPFGSAKAFKCMGKLTSTYRT